MPIGDEPNGLNWSGFQSVGNNKGYFLIFRAHSNKDVHLFKAHHLPQGKNIQLKSVAGRGNSFGTKIDSDGYIQFSLPDKHSFALYSYEVSEK